MKSFDSYTTPSTFLIIALFSGLFCATIEINILKLNYVFLLYCAQLYLTILLQDNNLIDTQLAINVLPIKVAGIPSSLHHLRYRSFYYLSILYGYWSFQSLRSLCLLFQFYSANQLYKSFELLGFCYTMLHTLYFSSSYDV